MKISQGEKKLFWSVTSAFVILGGGYGWRSYLNREPVVNIPPYPKLPSPNGFDLYVKAAKSIIPANPAVDEVNDGKPPTDPQVRDQQYSLSRKEAWLKQNKAAFQLFQKALHTPCLHPEARSTQSNVFPAYAPMREMARCKKIESKTYVMRGDWNGAMQSKIDTVQMGDDISRGGALIASLVGIAIQAIGRDTPWPIVEKLDASQCQTAIKRLEKLYDNRVQMSAVLSEDKNVGLTQLLEAMKSSKWRDVSQLRWPNTSVPLSTRWQALTISKRTICDNYQQRMNVQIANARLPYKAQKQPLPSQSDPYTDIFAFSLERTRSNFARNDAGNALWLVALALRAYKLENGSYPQNLKQLAPKYLREVPADPFGAGETLRYKQVENEYLLYSIGPDGVDDGGRAITYRNRASAKTRQNLPQVNIDSRGDYVAGKNR